MYRMLDGDNKYGEKAQERDGKRYLESFLCYSIAQSCPSLCYPMDCTPPGFSVHRDSPGKNTGVG